MPIPGDVKNFVLPSGAEQVLTKPVFHNNAVCHGENVRVQRIIVSGQHTLPIAVDIEKCEQIPSCVAHGITGVAPKV
jgi:hypothetical protein